MTRGFLHAMLKQMIFVINKEEAYESDGWDDSDFGSGDRLLCDMEICFTHPARRVRVRLRM